MRGIPSRRTGYPWSIVLLIGLGISSPNRSVLAQQVRPPAPRPAIQVAQLAAPTIGKPRAEVVNVFLPAPRELKLLLLQARRALEDDQYNDAVAALGTLLNGLDSDAEGPEEYAGDYFVGTPGQEGTHVSLRAEALRLLGSMPATGLKWYQLQYGAQAKRLLDEALREGDVEKIAEVTRRFFHTQAGYEATMLLGWYHLNQGRPLAAALCLKRIAATPAAARQYEPELSFLIATCWYSANEPEKARATLETIKDRTPEAEFRIGEADAKLFGAGKSPLAWLQDHAAPPRQTMADLAEQWVMFRGDAQRNAQVSGSPPLTNFRWFVRLALSRTDQRGTEQIQDQYIEQHMPALPAMHPLVVGDTVLVRTPWHLFAIDFDTGKLIWYYPWDESFDKQFLDGQSGLQAGLGGPRMRFIQQRTFSDAPYGQLSSDGRHVFVIDELGFASAGHFYRTIVQPGGLRSTNPGWPRTHNRLCGLDLEQQGKLKWIVGDETGEEEPRLARAFFLGAPLVLLRQLYAIAEIKGEIQLVVLDADTGRLQWSQQLAHVDTATIDRDPVRRLAGATPSFADGVVICPTSAGAVVAVDISTRSLLWGYQYQQTPTRLSASIFPVRTTQSSDQPGGRWADASVTISEGRVLVTPVKSGDLHCLDLLSGKLAWKTPRDDALFVGCVHGGTVLLVGKDRIQGLKLDTGKPAWPALAIASGGMPSGRGFASNGSYYLPTSAEELLQIDVGKGKLTKPMDTRGVLGNLVCHEDVVISQGVNLLTSFHQLDPLRRQVAERLKTKPDDVWALARRAEILLYDGRRQESLDVLWKAYQIEPRDDTRTLLVETLLGLLRDDFASHRDLAAKTEPLITRPQQREEYLRVMAEGWHKVGERQKAFEAYLRIAGFHEAGAGVSGGGPEVEMQKVNKHLSVRRERWAQTRIARLLREAAPDQKQQMETAIAEQLEAAVESDATAPLRRFIAHFDGHPLADSARIQLADKLVGQQRILEAEMLLARTQRSADPNRAATAAAAMAQLLTTAEHFEEAAACYRRLARDWPDVECRDDLTGSQVLAAIPGDSPVGRVLARPQDWPRSTPRTELSDKDTLGLASHSRLYRLNILSAEELQLPGVRASLDPAQARIAVRDGTGREMIELPLTRRSGTSFYSSNYGLTRGRFYGHLLVLSMGFEVIGLDTLQVSRNAAKREIWRHDLSQSVPGATRTRQYVRPIAVNNPWCGPTYVPRDQQGNPVGMLGPVNDRGLTFLRDRTLICVDPIRGEDIWKRNDCIVGSALFGDQETIVVIPPNSQEARLFRASDGDEIRTAKVPPSERRWTTHGRQILTWDDSPGKMTLRLYDPLTESDIWAFDFLVGSKGWIIDGKEVAVLEPTGDFVIIRMADGSRAVETQLDHQQSLTGIYVLASESTYVLVTNTPVTESPPNEHISPAPGGFFSPLVNGQAYAFDRRTGDALWPKPVRIDQFGLPLQQASELPVVVFLRQIRKTERGRSAGIVTSVRCVDKRSGEILYSNDAIPTQTRAFETVGDLPAARVSLMLPARTIHINFAEEEAASETAPESTPDNTAQAGPDSAQEAAIEAAPASEPAAGSPPKPGPPADENGRGPAIVPPPSP